eukprot:TRINITY_DN6923_c0_g1_i2.p1 TRINITY_DN6923_c0_g1~~TRINITY_DN6923_c0_g1_i2.p1  ORF type:complete len:235 (+),score=5.94 TRINITY_DN6923_c0_g1_i2:190-894(+)
MDISPTLEQFFGDAFEDSSTEQELQHKWDSNASPDNAKDGYFDCNICLDFACDPVVTLCGHLYCWPCIYKWLRLKNNTPQQCPVCKAAVSQTTLVPLYGRGYTSPAALTKTPLSLEVPRRPTAYRPHAQITTPASPLTRPSQHRNLYLPHQHQYQYPPTRVFHPSAGTFGGTALAVLPWVLGNTDAGLYYENPYYIMGGGNSPRLRREGMQVERSLSRVSMFLLCCIVLCLILF